MPSFWARLEIIVIFFLLHSNLILVMSLSVYISYFHGYIPAIVSEGNNYIIRNNVKHTICTNNHEENNNLEFSYIVGNVS